MSSNLLFSRNDGDNTKEQTKYKQTMEKSREIHRQLLNKVKNKGLCHLKFIEKSLEAK